MDKLFDFIAKFAMSLAMGGLALVTIGDVNATAGIVSGIIVAVVMFIAVTIIFNSSHESDGYDRY